MGAIGGTTRAGFGWLTAIMTLVAGLPHFVCQCPNGSIKPFSLGIFCSSSGCCCGDLCSGAPKDSRCAVKAASSRKGRPACCCAHRSGRPTPKQTGGPPRVEGRGCQKSPAPQQNLAPSAPTKLSQDRGAAYSALLNPTISTRPFAARTGTERAGLHLAAPPPSDLVIVLRRFLI